MKNEKKLLAKNTISLYIMNIVKLVFPLLTLPYLTRVLTTSTYGAVTYIKSLIVYVQLFLDFGFLLFSTKNIVNARSNKYKIGLIVGNTIVEKLLLGGVASVIYIFACFLIPIIKENSLFAIIYLLATLFSILILDFLYRGIEKMNYVAIPYIFSKTICLVFTFILVKNDSDLLFIPILELIGNFFASVISFILLKKVDIKIYFGSIKSCFNDIKESSIYFISNFATTFFGALTTIVAGFYVSTENIAFWGICMQLLSAAKALYNPLTNSLYPYMLRKKDIKLINRLAAIMLIPMLIGVYFIIFQNELILGIIGGDKYKSAGYILIYLLPAFVFSFYSMLYGWPVLGAINKEKETTFSTVLASTFQVIGLVIIGLLHFFNLKTLAICCSITEFILFVVRIVIVKKNNGLFNLEEVK